MSQKRGKNTSNKSTQFMQLHYIYIISCFYLLSVYCSLSFVYCSLVQTGEAIPIGLLLYKILTKPLYFIILIILAYIYIYSVCTSMYISEIDHFYSFLSFFNIKTYIYIYIYIYTYIYICI